MKADYTLLVNKANPINNDYIPLDLVEIHEPSGNKVDPNYINMLNKEAYINFKNMQKDALQEGYEIFIDSSYRSYEYQQRVYEASVIENGLEHTKNYCAIPGTSEHQTGLAIDIISRRNGIMIEDSKEDDPELMWCMDNSYNYGFILRYPKNKESITGYSFEPWHYRYVGKEASIYMHNNGITTLEEFTYEKEKLNKGISRSRKR